VRLERRCEVSFFSRCLVVCLIVLSLANLCGAPARTERSTHQHRSAACHHAPTRLPIEAQTKFFKEQKERIKADQARSDKQNRALLQPGMCLSQHLPAWHECPTQWNCDQPHMSNSKGRSDAPMHPKQATSSRCPTNGDLSPADRNAAASAAAAAAHAYVRPVRVTGSNSQTLLNTSVRIPRSNHDSAPDPTVTVDLPPNIHPTLQAGANGMKNSDTEVYQHSPPCSNPKDSSDAPMHPQQATTLMCSRNGDLSFQQVCC
jgi:hypothetical protein